MVKNLIPGLSERGKIKIGVKGRMITSKAGNQFQPPEKLDHFLITTLEREADGNFRKDLEIHKLYGEKPCMLPVRLLYNDIDLNFPTRYVAFKGKTLWCSGDGESAQRLDSDGKHRHDRTCPCECLEWDYEGPLPKCKINGCLSVMIDGSPRVGGVWKLRTTSRNTVIGILSSLQLIQTLTGGILAGLPLEMSLSPKTVILPNGKSSMVYIVSLEYKGNVASLREIAWTQAKEQANYIARLETLEEQARRRVANEIIDVNEVSDVVDEFYPEQAKASVIPPAEEEVVGVDIAEPAPERDQNAQFTLAEAIAEMDGIDTASDLTAWFNGHSAQFKANRKLITDYFKKRLAMLKESQSPTSIDQPTGPMIACPAEEGDMRAVEWCREHCKQGECAALAEYNEGEK